MKTLLVATVVLFSISTTAFAFEMPNMEGLDVQQLQQAMKGKGGKRFLRQLQQGDGQQQSSGGGLQGLMNGDMSGLQGVMSRFGR